MVPQTGMKRVRGALLLFALLLALPAVAQQAPAQTPEQPQPNSAVEQVIDRIIAAELETVKDLRNYSPLIEAYVQEVRPDAELGNAPNRDHYFLGKAMLAKGVVFSRMNKTTDGWWSRNFGGLNIFSRRIEYLPSGFLQMIYVDPKGLNREQYEFKYVRREFLGEVRCLVFDVTPRKNAPRGSFVGRVWAEDQGFHIVRFNGTYTGSQPYSLFFHLDSWRVNVAPDKWMPAFIDLSAYAGEEVNLIFNVRAGVGGKSGNYTNILALWGAPAVVVR